MILPQQAKLGFIRSTCTSRDSSRELSSERIIDILDIFIQRIFSHCHPSDLFSLSQCNRWLKALLASPIGGEIWNISTGRLPHFPDAPIGISRHKWLVLLFQKRCQKCGSHCEEADYQASPSAKSQSRFTYPHCIDSDPFV